MHFAGIFYGCPFTCVWCFGHYKARDLGWSQRAACTMTRDHFLSCRNIGLHQSGDPVAVILNTILLAKPLLWTNLVHYAFVHSRQKGK